MNFKDFIRPTKSKILLTLLFFAILVIVGLACGGAFFQSNSCQPSTIALSEKIEWIFMWPGLFIQYLNLYVFKMMNYIPAGITYFFVLAWNYILASTIVSIYRKFGPSSD